MASVPMMDWNSAMLADQQSGQKATADALRANRPNQNTPWGSSTWSQDPTTGQWTQNVSLAPQQQNQLNNQMNSASMLSQQKENLLSGGAAGNLGQATSAPGYSLGLFGGTNPAMMNAPSVTAGGVPGVSQNGTNISVAGINLPSYGFDSAEKIQQAMLSRLDPAFQQQKNAEQARLKAMGITEGSEAWNNSMDQAGRNWNDMQMQALLGGASEANNQYSRALNAAQLANQGQIANAQLSTQASIANAANAMQRNQLAENARQFNVGMDTTRQNQMFNQGLVGRNQQMNELDWLGGAPVSSPQFGSFVTAGTAPSTNYAGMLGQMYGNQMDQYNANAAKNASLQQGLWGLGSDFLNSSAGQSAMSGIGSYIGGLFG